MKETTIMAEDGYDANRIYDITQIANSVELGKMWICPECGIAVGRKLLREANEGKFPQDYDYTTYESDGDFLLRIIDHRFTHVAFVKKEIP